MKSIKTLSVILFICVLLTVCFPFSASALVFRDGDFGYTLNSVTKEATLVSYAGSESFVIIPSRYNDYVVTGIASGAFENNDTMEQVNIPLTVKTIETEAFLNCSAMLELSIPNSVVSIGEGVCYGCSALTTARVYPSFTQIPDFMFAYCSSLENVTINANTKKIGQGAFQYCTSLKNIDFAVSVTEIAETAFLGTALTDLSIPDGITALTYQSFANCAELENVVIGKNIIEINPYTFKNSNKVIVNCYYDSCAYSFAINTSTPYILLDGVKLGDVDGDGNVNINDVTRIQRHLAELEQLVGINLYVADANQDGTLDISDATSLQMYLAEYDIPYLIGEVITQ